MEKKNSPEMDSDGFILVSGRRARRRRAAEGHSRQYLASMQVKSLEDPKAWVQGRFRTARKRFSSGEGKALASKFVSALRQTGLAPFEDCICLGLGKLSTTNAENQLGLLATLLLVPGLFTPECKVTCFDPDFDANDQAALRLAGFNVIASNDMGKAHDTGGSRTLFFMPHCPLALYNNIFWANWTNKQLTKLVIVGNTLRAYFEKAIPPPEAPRCKCVQNVLAKVAEYRIGALTPSSDMERAFNDTCVQHLPPKALQQDLPARPDPVSFDKV